MYIWKGLEERVKYWQNRLVLYELFQIRHFHLPDWLLKMPLDVARVAKTPCINN